MQHTYTHNKLLREFTEIYGSYTMIIKDYSHTMANTHQGDQV